jgi:GT2 family glycosyltransferase
LESLFSDFASVDYHHYGKNIGYGRAHNWGVKHSKESRYHLIMNPDIIITPGAIENLVGFMDKNQDVGMTCPRILNEDGSDQYLNKRYPSVADLFSRRFVPGILNPLVERRMYRFEMKDVGYDHVCDVEYMTGAFMFCRTAVLRAVGGFDPRYFMYFEDCDLGRKMQQYGYRTVYYPNARVIHHWERASYKDLRMTIIHIANMCRYFNKWGWKLF